MTAQDRRRKGGRFARCSRTDHRVVGPPCDHRVWRAYERRHGRLPEIARIEAEAECETSADFRQQTRPQCDDKIIESDVAAPHDRQSSVHSKSFGYAYQFVGMRKRCFGTDEINRSDIGALPV